jgi:indole-3-glycerol phosphate synthase
MNRPPEATAFMTTILDRIVSYKRDEIAAARTRVSEAELRRRIRDARPVRDFRAALSASPGVAVIAEVKRASPSAGVIRADFDPVAVARAYAESGAACVSVLTDGPSFQGDLAYLEAIAAAVSIPALRKDFLLDPYQVLEARAAGADAVLLIAEILDDDTLRRLLAATKEQGMRALVELYDSENLPRVLAAGADLVGVNNRDLRTFVVRLEHTLELAAQMPPHVCLVSESGIKTGSDVARLKAAGVRAILVGETLMRADDVSAKMRELATAGGGTL